MISIARHGLAHHDLGRNVRPAAAACTPWAREGLALVQALPLPSAPTLLARMPALA